MKKIKLTNYGYSLIDDEDFDKISKYKWYAVKNKSGKIYAKRTVGGFGMHRVILKDRVGFEIDHINGNSLDNRKSNLRIATKSQNQANTNKRVNNSSGYKGVSWNKVAKKWHVQIIKDRQFAFRAYFKNKEDAARIYIIKAKE